MGQSTGIEGCNFALFRIPNNDTDMAILLIVKRDFLNEI